MAIYSTIKMNPKTGQTTRVTAPKSAPSKAPVNSTTKNVKPPATPVVNNRSSSKPASKPRADVSIQPVRPGSVTKKSQLNVATPPVVAPRAQGAAYVPSGNRNRVDRIVGGAPKVATTTPSLAAAPATTLPRSPRPPAVQDKTLEDAALADSLKSFSEGGANVGVPAGTDIPSKLSSDEGFKKLLQEQIYTRAYGTGKPTFAAPEASPAVSPTPEPTAPPAGQSDVADLMGRFGLTPTYSLDSTSGTDPAATPETVPPSLTDGYDKQIEALANSQFDTSAAQTAYEAKLADIQARYAAQRDAARRQVQNQTNERFSNLAGVGFNPLSSGGNALENEKNQLIAQYDQQIGQQEEQEKSIAASEFAAAQQAATEGRMQYLKDARDAVTKREETSYNRGRNTLNDSIAVLNATLNAQEKNRLLSDTERDNTVNSFKTVLSELGSSAFDGLGDADLRTFESALGLPAGALRGALASYKAAELKAAKEGNRPELREVGGNLYQMTFDTASGSWVPKVILSKPTASGPSSSIRRVTTTKGGEITDADYAAAQAAYSQAYADTPGAWENKSREDKDDIVSNYIYLGGSPTNNPFLNSRRTAEAEFGGRQNDLQSKIDAIANAFGNE